MMIARIEAGLPDGAMSEIDSSGIVRDVAVHGDVCDAISAAVTSFGWRVVDVIPSPITGGDGNAEFLLGATRD